MRYIKRRYSSIKADTDVATEATDLLFEVEDVADLVSEITGEDVEVTADESTAEFTVGDDVYTVEADGNEEILEASTRITAGRGSTGRNDLRKVERMIGKTYRNVDDLEEALESISQTVNILEAKPNKLVIEAYAEDYIEADVYYDTKRDGSIVVTDVKSYVDSSTRSRRTSVKASTRGRIIRRMPRR